MIKLTFLSAAVPLTKTFVLNSGVLEKQAHPKITSCTSHEEEVANIEQFKTALEAHAELGHCLLKGNVNRPLDKESRKGSTDPNAKTAWVCLDIDGLKGTKDVNDLLIPMGLADVDHIIQYSSSMGVDPKKGLSAHVYMMIDKEALADKLKRWLIQENLTQDILVDNLNLTRTGNALRWGLDVTTCQNDKLIYIAPPILGKGVKDFLKGDRIVLVKRAKRSFTMPTTVPNAEKTRELVQMGLNRIRKREGLSPKPASSSQKTGSVEWETNPDSAQVTGIKEDGPFVHLNINGGDSWAYWHHKSNPEFIHNFKGEPSYRTSELLPEYWKTLRPDDSGARPDPDGVEYIVFRDFRTATYHNAIWVPETKKLEIATAKGKDQLKDFLKSHGAPSDGPIADWKVEFDPQSGKIVDHDKRIINLFQPTEYMLMEPSKGARVPPLIHKTIWNAFGSDQETYEHFMNWLAVSFQFRMKCQTCWMTYGTTGTGKGTLVNQILAKLYGPYVEFKRSADMDSIFNEFLEKALILWIDEAHTGGKNGGSFVENDMKNYITEPIVSIRRMHQASYPAKSYVSTILSSNNKIPHYIPPEDRRFNIAPFQKEKLVFKSGEYEVIPEQVPEFAQYLLAYPADKELARTPLDNEAKKTLIFMGRKGTDDVIDHLKDGDYQFFVDNKPATYVGSSSGEQELAAAYAVLVDDLKKQEYLLREEVQQLLGYLMDKIPKSPYKFVSLMKHHDIIFENIERNGKQFKGIKVNWK